MIYPITPEVNARLLNDHTYHTPSGDQVVRYAQIRAHALDTARFFVEHCPPSRELSLALTHLEESVFFANAAIARNEKYATPDFREPASVVFVSENTPTTGS